jgi:hypothetical protein
MTNPLPVPCPHCGGLVDRAAVKCTACGYSWPSVLELELDGALAAIDRACVIVETVGVTQEYWDAIALERRYQLEIERTEKRR